MIKKCSKCQEEKSINDFYKASKGRYGRKSSCKVCSDQASIDNKPKKKTLRDFYLENPDVVLPLSPRRKARMLLGEGFFTAEEWKGVLAANDYRCAKCGSEDNITIDHVIPLSRGGTNYIINIQPLCFTCNGSKSNHFAEDYTWRDS